VLSRTVQAAGVEDSEMHGPTPAPSGSCAMTGATGSKLAGGGGGAGGGAGGGRQQQSRRRQQPVEVRARMLCCCCLRLPLSPKKWRRLSLFV
jgi:hypothetical protein